VDNQLTQDDFSTVVDPFANENHGIGELSVYLVFVLEQVMEGWNLNQA
jgi:hypothetical protein